MARANRLANIRDNVLIKVLEALGFQDVQPTQATRDGGVDARVTY
jgi:hypothetical protein